MRGPTYAGRVSHEEVRVSADIGALSIRVAEAATTIISDAVKSRGRCAVALSGGGTPKALYTLLASRFRDAIPWTRVHVFWADERYVPAGDAHSNYTMAKEALLDHVPCPPGNIHPMPTTFPLAEDAAREYERVLRGHFGTDVPRFDLIFLGLGEDGHTASLFPGSPSLQEQARSVVAVSAPATPSTRITLTMPVLTRAAHIHVLVAGANKASALRHVLSGTADPALFPAARLRSAEGTLTWWVDEDAAGSSSVILG
ncbi:MAG: 6-phosphogluconolactonase [Acidobacteria bacterium]|nr:6-phosphogluconolactonase [Acidobacteriota bacterium]